MVLQWDVEVFLERPQAALEIEFWHNSLLPFSSDSHNAPRTTSPPRDRGTRRGRRFQRGIAELITFITDTFNLSVIQRLRLAPFYIDMFRNHSDCERVWEWSPPRSTYQWSPFWWRLRGCTRDPVRSWPGTCCEWPPTASTLVTLSPLCQWLGRGFGCVCFNANM